MGIARFFLLMSCGGSAFFMGGCTFFCLFCVDRSRCRCVSLRVIFASKRQKSRKKQCSELGGLHFATVATLCVVDQSSSADLDNPDGITRNQIVKLSNRGRYALRALFDIAFFCEGRPAQVREIAERQEIPPRFLEQIFQDLKRAKIVISRRGPQGGYTLAQSPEAVLLGEVMEAVEGTIQLADESADADLLAPEIRITEEHLGYLSEKLKDVLNQSSLADLIARAEKSGLSRTQNKAYVYVI